VYETLKAIAKKKTSGIVVKSQNNRKQK